MEYFIYVTNDCNLNCQYCSVLIDCKKTSIPIDINYSLEQLSNFITNIQNNINSKKFRIIFFGGEPSLRYEKINEIISHMKKKLKNFEIEFVLHTNGLLLNYKLKNIDLIFLSINYELLPMYNLKDSYFSTIIEGYFSNNINKISTIARLTITEKTSLLNSVLITYEIFGNVYWQIENKLEFKNYENFSITYKFEIKTLFDIWLKKIKQGYYMNFIPFVSAVRFMLDETDEEMTFSCGYGNNMIYIQTDGSCYYCCDSVINRTHFAGNIDSGIKLKYISLKTTKCGDCMYLKMCKGRCGRMYKEFTQEHMNRYCELNIYLFDLVIENKNFFINQYNNIDFKKFINNSIVNATEFTS